MAAKRTNLVGDSLLDALYADLSEYPEQNNSSSDVLRTANSRTEQQASASNWNSHWQDLVWWRLERTGTHRGIRKMTTMAGLKANRNRNTRRLARLAWSVRTVMITGIWLTPCHTPAATVNIVPAPPAQPAQSTEYMAYGQGRQLCDSYVEARQQGRAGAYLELNYFRQWMAGYMSSYNLFRLGGKDSIAAAGDEDIIESSLETYCREHPEEKFASAAAAIIKQLQERR